MYNKVIESVEQLIKSGKLIAVTKCCNAPIEKKNYKNRRCPICLSVKSNSEVTVFTKKSYYERIKETSN